jgi:hypothetical protein
VIRQPRLDGCALSLAGGNPELATVEHGALSHAHQPEMTVANQVGWLLRWGEAGAVIPNFQGEQVWLA